MFSARGAASLALAAVLDRVFIAGVVGGSDGMGGFGLRFLRGGAGMLGCGETGGTGAVASCLVKAHVMR